MKKIPLPPFAPKELSLFETRVIVKISNLLKIYREKLEDADRTEKTMYSVFVSDLEKLLAEVVHS
jgi:hypothetical protein